MGLTVFEIEAGNPARPEVRQSVGFLFDFWCRVLGWLATIVRGSVTMVWQERITIDPKVLVGKPIIRGTRISVEFVVDLLARGWTTGQILKEYDHLTPDDIQACLAYASDLLKSERVYPVPTP